MSFVLRSQSRCSPSSMPRSHDRPRAGRGRGAARKGTAEDERVERQDACRRALRAPERRAAAVVEDPVALLLISKHELAEARRADHGPKPAGSIPSPSA